MYWQSTSAQLVDDGADENLAGASEDHAGAGAGNGHVLLQLLVILLLNTVWRQHKLNLNHKILHQLLIGWCARCEVMFLKEHVCPQIKSIIQEN